MKHLILATLCFLLLLVPWSLYNRYSSSTINKFTAVLNEEVIPAIEQENWTSAKSSYSKLVDDWDRFHKISDLFLNNKATDETCRLVYRVEERINMHDYKNAAADLTDLSHSIQHLYENERLALGNIL